MGLSLYRKYRPQVFADVIGQEAVVETLLHQSKQRSFAHAYLFTGPRGVGKTTIARLLAKSANCTKVKKDGDIDTTDPACQLIHEGKAIDIIEIDAASHTGVDHVRSVIIESSRTTPTSLPYKVFIIDEVHMLSGSAFNALLKTLEEPPQHAMFILATTEIHKVPETIISRCQRFTFNRLSVAHLIARLERIAQAEKVSVEKEVLQEIAVRAEGSSRDAESILGQLLAFGEKKITKKQADIILPRSHVTDVSRFVHIIIDRDAKTAIDFINRFVEEGGNANQFMHDTISFVRMMLLLEVGSPRLDEYVASELPPEIFKSAKQDARSSSQFFLLKFLEILLRTERQFVYHDIPQLPLEIAVYELLTEDGDSDKNQRPPADSGHQAHKQSAPHAPAKDTRASGKPKGKPAKVSLSLIKEKWQDFTSQIREVNRGLSMSMQVASPIDVREQVVTLGVPYAFHCEQIMMPQHTALIEKKFEEYFNIKLRVGCEVRASKSSVPQANVEPVSKNDGLWNQVMEAFGDQLVSSK